MKHRLEFIHYDGMSVHRGCFELPDVSPEEFDTGKHMGTVFRFPEGDEPVNPMLYVWEICTPTTDEETKKLIEMGKWGASNLKPIIK